ncbi:amidohydrolase family protein [Paenibacillus chondroitinus]|uniref:Amidohydrolase family protein n=1 Tax=Paenibacillus chondroitinus TaxID=59842 RepID=A0ABU6DDN0_9BACL|nr:MULTISPECIES: amidohydrolase family protein [Paenibacillus]MCY9659985.1 amidohydrolase family protein [Paenibacillus anseongense]MEB4795397.1 amidohydrolase family protein [Paenibacillus chondroitinus]
MIIDTHQHFWNLEKVAYPWLDPSFGSICRTIEADELEPLIRKAGINKTVIVQAMNSYEDTDYMLKVAAEREWVGAVVGWVPLNIPGVADKKLQEYAANPYFKGVRHLIHEEKDPDWVIRDSVIEGLKILSSFGLTFDIVGEFPNHLKHVPYLAEKIPDLRMVIDHFAKPPIKEKQMGAWAEQFAAAAQYPNVYAKVSGLNTAADWHTWSSEDLRPYIDYALTHFGADRLMFGSDWPVANLAGDYEKVWEQTNRAIADYSEHERAAILGGTAAKFYGIQAES